jgi:hypothetical protein
MFIAAFGGVGLVVFMSRKKQMINEDLNGDVKK